MHTHSNTYTREERERVRVKQAYQMRSNSGFSQHAQCVVSMLPSSIKSNDPLHSCPFDICLVIAFAIIVAVVWYIPPTALIFVISHQLMRRNVITATRRLMQTAEMRNGPWCGLLQAAMEFESVLTRLCSVPRVPTCDRAMSFWTGFQEARYTVRSL